MKVRAEATGITLNEPSQGSIGFVLTLGATRYCSTFGGTVARDEPGMFRAKNAPAPAACAISSGGVTWFIPDGPDEQSQTLVAFFAAVSGDTIEFGEGAFEFDTTLVMAAHGEDGITIRGQGRGKTILDFLGSGTPEGLSFSPHGRASRSRT